MSVKKNFMYNTFYQILTIILPFLTAPYISRVLNPDGVGSYSYTYSIASYFMLFILLGLNNYGNRMISISRDNKKALSKMFFSIYYMQLVIGVIVVCLYIFYSIFYTSNVMLSLVQSLFVISSIFDINWFFFGLEKFKLTVIRNTVIKIITVIFIFIFVKDENDLTLYALIMAVGILISQLILWPFLLKEIFLVKVNIKEVIYHIIPNLKLFIPVLALSIYKIMDKVMLGNMSGMSEVAYYENSEKFISIPIMLINSLGTVLLPKISYLYSKGKMEKINKYLKSSLFLSLFITVPISFGIIAISKYFIPIFYGYGYEKCIKILYVLLPSTIFIAWGNALRTQYLIPRKQDQIYINSAWIGAIVNVIINYLLIPKQGAVGAAYGTLFAEISVCFYISKKVNSEFSLKSSLLLVLPSIIFGTFMLIMVSLIPYIINGVITIFVKTICGVIIYALPAYFYLKFLKRRNLL